MGISNSCSNPQLKRKHEHNSSQAIATPSHALRKIVGKHQAGTRYPRQRKVQPNLQSISREKVGSLLTRSLPEPHSARRWSVSPHPANVGRTSER
ncbi:hypothetical protein GW17_00004339 [Ensete ventricosum]|nr:hypothetical protein GW17_00004339 [Ensete ventricosum]